MADERNNPRNSLVFWLVPTVALIGFGIWCIIDGWFRPGFEHATFSKVITPVSFVAALWCLREGLREYRKVKSEAAGQGGEAEKPSDGQDNPPNPPAS